MRMTRVLTLLAVGALAAVPVAEAGQKIGDGSGSKSKQCKKPTKKKSFVVKGTLDASVTDAGGAPTHLDGSVIDITVTGANRHARKSGEIADQDPGRAGVQVRGADYMVDGATDQYNLKLSGYEASEDPEAGDKVRIKGKIPVAKKKCAAPDATLDERYGEPNVKKVKVIDKD